jgi:hypothetical protein
MGEFGTVKVLQAPRTRTVARPRSKESVSGFLIPVRTMESYYLVAIIRDRSTRRRQMDLALCHALQPVLAKILHRLEEEERDAHLEFNRHLRAIDQHNLLDDFCRIVENRVGANSVLLLYADQDLKALSLASHHNAAPLAEHIGLLLPSDSALANWCYSHDTPLFGQIVEDTIVTHRLGPDGNFDSDSLNCRYQRGCRTWLQRSLRLLAAANRSSES